MSANTSNPPVPPTADRLGVAEIKEQILIVISPANVRPPFSLVTMAQGPAIVAQVTYEQGTGQYKFLLGAASSSHREAYEKLLALTEGILQTKQHELWGAEGTDTIGNAVDVCADSDFWSAVVPAFTCKQPTFPDGTCIFRLHFRIALFFDFSLTSSANSQHQGVATTSVLATVMATPDEDRLSFAEVKEQIVANCATLWPIFYPCSSNGGDDDRPELNINTHGGRTNVSASVVYKKEDGLYVMMNGPYASSQREACERLLTMTSDILVNFWSKKLFYEDGLRVKKAGSGGTYYAK